MCHVVLLAVHCRPTAGHPPTHLRAHMLAVPALGAVAVASSTSYTGSPSTYLTHAAWLGHAYLKLGVPHMAATAKLINRHGAECLN